MSSDEDVVSPGVKNIGKTNAQATKKAGGGNLNAKIDQGKILGFNPNMVIDYAHTIIDNEISKNNNSTGINRANTKLT